MQLAATRTPHPKIRLLRPLHQEHLILLIETIEQRGDFVREGHETRYHPVEGREIIIWRQRRSEMKAAEDSRTPKRWRN
jgi:hypothetical protein